jgi:hypothetical protein
MVTIAKEPKYYKACCDSKSVSNEEALDILRGALLGNK